MLLFRSEEEIDRWVHDASRERGAVLTLPQMWRLAQLWYHDRLDADFRGRTAAQVEQIFAEVGLTSDFWKF